MHSRLKIVVLTHEKDNHFICVNYFIKLLIKEWEHIGFTVEVVRGIDYFIEADIVIPHIDLTIIPAKYLDYIYRYPIVINKHVLDISKSKISTNIVGRNDPYDGPVIVKTNFNCGGIGEKRISFEERTLYPFLSKLNSKLVSKLRRKCEGRVLWKHVKTLNPNHYPIYSSLKEVPKNIFNNKNLVVEKFLVETEGDNYCLRNWLFFAEKGVNVLSRSNKMIIKASNTFQSEEVLIPAELYSIREQLRVDYGKFDYVLRDGKVVLFDVNRTPTFKGPEPSQFVCKAARLLAEGLWSQVI